MKHNFSKMLFCFSVLALLGVASCSPSVTSGDESSFTGEDSSSKTDVVSSSNDIEDGTTLISSIKKEDKVGQTYTVKGVFARSYSAEYSGPQGFYLFDNSDSIYIMASNFADQISEFYYGNVIKVTGTYTKWISSRETEGAAANNYSGARQITADSIEVVEGESLDIPSTSYSNSTIKDIVSTPYSTNITSNTYMIKAYIFSSGEGDLFNYYISDLDQSYTLRCYSNNNKTVHKWLDNYAGKYYNILVAVHNASMTSAKTWRLVPIAVFDELTDTTTYQKDTVLYEGSSQFETEYKGNVEITLKSKSSKIDGATLSYESSDPDITFTESDDGIVMKNNASVIKDVNISIYAHLNNVKYEKLITVSFGPSEEKPVDYISVEEALNASLNEEVTVKGRIIQFLYNKPSILEGAVIIDESTGVAIQVRSFKDENNNDISTSIFANAKIGNDIIVKGTREVYQFRQQLNNCTLISNDYQIHNINYSIFDNKVTTIKELNAFDNDASKGEYVWDSSKLNTAKSLDENHSTIIYKMSVYIKLSEGNYPVYQIFDNEEDAADGGIDLRQKLYSQSNGDQIYSWLEPYKEKQVDVYYMVRLAKSASKRIRPDGLIIGVIDGENVINS